MAEIVPLDPKRAFFAPQFQIKLKGQKIGRDVIADVIDVTYTDDEINLDSFEFTLGDWDPVALRPKYSSPWDKDGNPYKIGGEDAPNFEPGAAVELYLWYQGEGDPVLMLKGDIVSIAPSFPAAGAPVCRVRALNYLNRLQREHITTKKPLEGTKMENAEKIALQVGVKEVKMPADVKKMGKVTSDTLNNAVVYEELLKRARDSGLVMWLEHGDDGPVLHFEAPAASEKPVASLAWGLNLVSFTPQLSTRFAVEKIVVMGSDPKQKGAAKAVQAQATWGDLPTLNTKVLGLHGLEGVQKAVLGSVETITDAEIRTEEDAKARAVSEMTKLAGELVKASGSAIGMPELRAGRIVEITRLGERFSGLYRLSQTTHTIGPSGYTVAFQAKKLVLT